MKNFKSFVADIKDTQFGQRITLENGEVVFNRKDTPVELGFQCSIDHYDAGEEQEWMTSEEPIGKEGRNYLQSANPVGNSLINRLRLKNLERQYEMMEATASI